MNFHENAPKKLIEAVAAAGSMRKFAAKQEINISFVSQLLSDGIEPTDQTEKGREVRGKLFLRKRKPKPGAKKRIYLPGERRKRKIIAKMARDTAKDVLIRGR